MSKQGADAFKAEFARRFEQLHTRIQIKTNVLLKGADPTVTLEQALALKKGYEVFMRLTSDDAKNLPSVSEAQLQQVQEQSQNKAENLSLVSEAQLQQVQSLYGDSGLFKLIYLATGHSPQRFNHFFEPIDEADFLRRTSPMLSTLLDPSHIRPLPPSQVQLECDNGKLPHSKDLAKFCLNVFQPSLSRKLYHPGVHPGWCVYGFGGPKILVSLPFRGRKGEDYDALGNSGDVLTSLMTRGYAGTFLFFDYLPSLNSDVHGIPEWLVWFAIVAAHSDLVLYVKANEKGFGKGQIDEIKFTPDRVQKKIVEIPHQELIRAEKIDADDKSVYLYIGEGREITREEWYEMEAKEARPFINQYAHIDFPNDRLIRIDESHNITEYPLDYPIYGDEKGA